MSEKRSLLKISLTLIKITIHLNYNLCSNKTPAPPFEALILPEAE